MATSEELREEFKKLVEETRTVIDEIVSRVNDTERTNRLPPDRDPTPGERSELRRTLAIEKIQESQKVQDELTDRIKGYSREISMATRSMQTVRESIGKLNSATLNAVTSIFSTFNRDKKESELAKFRLERQEARVTEVEGRQVLAVQDVKSTESKISAATTAAKATDVTKSEQELGKLLPQLGIEVEDGKTSFQTLNEKLKELTGKELADLSNEEVEAALKKLSPELKRQEVEVKRLSDEYKKETEKRQRLQEELKNLKFDRIINAMNGVAKAFEELVNSIRKTQQQFGITASQAASVKFGNLAESVNSYISAILTGGASGAPVSRQQIAGVQQAFQTEFGGVLTSAAARRMAQRGVEEGITPEQQAAARRTFMTITGDRERAIVVETKFIQAFKDANLTSKDALEAASKYSELIARNGTRFGDAFARAAKEAKQIGVDLTKIDQFGDNIINNFEGFLEAQAELGAMGFGFDTSRLAEIAATGNTAALQRELQSQLQTTGKNLEQLSRPERLSLESALGMTIADIQKLAKGESSGESIEDLTKKSNTFLDAAVNLLSGLGAGISVVAGLISLSNVFLGKIAFFSGLGGAGGMGGMLGTLGRFGLGAVGTIGLGTSAYGAYSLAKEGNTGAGYLTGALGGAASGAMIGSVIPGVGTAVGAGVGALIGAGIGLTGAAVGHANADDMVSKPGYGERVLVTPTATVALNDQDNVVAYADDMVAQEAGLKLLSKGAITSTTTPDLSSLEKVFERNIGQLRESFDRATATRQEIKIYMDGKEVGKGIYNNTEKAQSMEVFGIPSRATY